MSKLSLYIDHQCGATLDWSTFESYQFTKYLVQLQHILSLSLILLFGVSKLKFFFFFLKKKNWNQASGANIIKPHQEMQFLAIYIHVKVKGEREDLRSRILDLGVDCVMWVQWLSAGCLGGLAGVGEGTGVWLLFNQRVLCLLWGFI